MPCWSCLGDMIDFDKRRLDSGDPSSENDSGKKNADECDEDCLVFGSSPRRMKVAVADCGCCDKTVIERIGHLPISMTPVWISRAA
jgi:hypothetical protein